jgi:hypothetical protein
LLLWWGEAPESSNRLSEAIGNDQPTLFRYALNRAEPWSIVGHGSASLPALLIISRAFVRCSPGKSPGSSGASPHQSCPPLLLAPGSFTDYCPTDYCLLLVSFPSRKAGWIASGKRFLECFVYFLFQVAVVVVTRFLVRSIRAHGVSSTNLHLFRFQSVCFSPKRPDRIGLNSGCTG